MRADLLLVAKGLASSRARAQDLISKGRVYLEIEGNHRPIAKASFQVDPALEDAVFIRRDPEDVEYVSRGGIKMRGALERTRLDVRNRSILDIGISTGGFTDCLLQSGASHVVGVDVGHDQLAAKLRADPRVEVVEGVNARDLSRAGLADINGGRKFDLIVVDVSFISLTLVLPELIQYLDRSASLLALVKPQFEVGREGLGKNGVVKTVSLYRDVELKIREACERTGIAVEDYFESAIAGADGNREFFVFARAAQLQIE